ncbi:pilus assembly protein PilP [Pseudomonas promysalinigenes]|uniref:Pilus assembly protein PilP n=1 Tax=Pseudomonas promysalinigenes TaxID=485898 RepID=A0ABY6AN79_9PSED|nr:pilus assembly protein PilP [Pseudomonas promysalinigenes]UXH39716.1 pilus assembly protein PilP [Pseudomonas promysalinigenes]
MNLLRGGEWLALIERLPLARSALPGILCIVVFGFGCLLLLPQWLQREEVARARYVGLLEDQQAAIGEVKALGQLRENYEAELMQLQDARWRLAAGAGMSDLLDQLAASGHAHGLHFEQLDVGEEVKRPGYWQTPVDIRVVGGYAGLRVWLDDWLGQVRLLRAETMRLEPTEDRPGLLSLGMRVYVYQADGSVPQPSSLADVPARGQMQPVSLDPFSASPARVVRAGLAGVALAQLQMVGSLQRGEHSEALVLSAGRVYRVRPGDRLGREGGVVVQVGERQFEVRERLFVGGVWRERTVTLKLRKSMKTEATEGDDEAVEMASGGLDGQSGVSGSALSG